MTDFTKFCMGCMDKYAEEVRVCPYCGFIDGTSAEEALHMDPGSILRERYIIGRVLGFGGFGVTYIGWDALLEQKVAIKEYLPSEFSTRSPGQTQVSVFSGNKAEQYNDGRFKFMEEAKKLAKFHNESGIVKIFDSFEENNTAYIVMEYLHGETLKDYLERENTIPPDMAIEMLSPIIHSLKAVHKQGIIHRDIAPDNIFITNDGKVKLIDFGAARFATTSHSRSLSVIIKQGYSPEEQYRSKDDQGAYTDVYAIGATLYRMIVGIVPPDAMERRATFEGNKKDVLLPLSRASKEITENQETAILNALNLRIEDRTPNMETLARELHTEEPEKVKRLYGKIRKIDVLRWPLWAKIATPAAMLAIAAFGVLFSLGIIGGEPPPPPPPDGMTRVPSVVNTALLDAELRLDEAMLLLSIVGLEYSGAVPADFVLLQNLQAGMLVMENEIVEVTISGGLALALVPDVTGFDSEEATSIFEELGFIVQFVEEYHNVLARGSVIRQSVEPDTDFAVGEVITIAISLGPEFDIEQMLAIVPNFVGTRFEEALEEAERAGFLLSISAREYSTDVPAGVVLSQDIIAHSEMMTGTTILLTVARGVHVSRMPSIQFRTEEEARRAIEFEGLIPEVTFESSEIVAEGVVISQFPEPGVTLEPGTTVSFVVSSGPESFAMPDVVQLSEDSANTTLTGLGLAVSVEREVSSDIPSGDVIRQSVPAGTAVTRGSMIVLTVAADVQLIQVPNVVGRTLESAVSLLQDFNVTINEIHHATVANRNVIAQTPTAGSQQLPNTSVSINVSLGPQTFTIAFNANGGTPAPSNRTVSGGSTITLPSISRSGHRLDGWFTAASGGSRVTEHTTISSNMNLFAQWVINPWTEWSASTPPANAFQSESRSSTEHRYRNETAWGTWGNWDGTNPGPPSETREVESRQEWRSRDSLMGDWDAWSSWAEFSPGTTTEAREVESRQEWRQRIRAWGPWGSWTDWSPSSPGSATDSMEVESGQEWRSRNSNLGPWGAWTEWTPSSPGAASPTMEVESRQEWRTRTLGDWGPWGDWGTHNPGASTDTLQVEHRHVPQHGVTRHHYYHWCTPDGGIWTTFAVSGNRGRYCRTHSDVHLLPLESANWHGSGMRVYRGSSCGHGQPLWFRADGIAGGSNIPDEWVITQHARDEWRSRQRGWTTWPIWGTTNPGPATATMQVEQRTVWRSRTRTMQWGDWGPWGTHNPGAPSDTMQVEQRAVWRSRTRVMQWGDWGSWDTINPGANTDTRESEQRTVWRFRTRTRVWGNWTDWSTHNPGIGTETREVEARNAWRSRTRPARWGEWSTWRDGTAISTPTRDVETRNVTEHRWIPD